jgi:pimeloyl-ACP methyl ester carboxylesterase
MRQLLYFPERQDPARAAAEASRLGLAPWTGAAGRFLGWREAAPPPPPRARLLVLHGNAGTALDRVHYRQVFPERQGSLAVEVLLLEYPGYGPRPGAPTEETVVAACREAVADLRREPGPVILVGESLGSAAAALCAAAGPAEVDGLLLVTPLQSVAAVARRHYGLAPSFLIPDTYRADLALPRYGGPVAFLVAGRDEVVFPDLGLALHAAYPGPKRLWVQEQATHNTVRWDPADPAWGEMLAFLLGGAARR